MKHQDDKIANEGIERAKQMAQTDTQNLRALLRRAQEEERSQAQEWAWMPQYSENAVGPFSSKEAALEDARKYHKGEHVKILIGPIQYPDPVRYLDAEVLVETLNDHAADEDFAWYDDAVFWLDGDAAEATRALAEWAKRWVRSERVWTIAGEEWVTT